MEKWPSACSIVNRVAIESLNLFLKPIKKKKLMFTFEWEIVKLSMSRGEEEREGDRIWSRLQDLSYQHRAQCGPRTHKPRDHDLSQSWIFNQLNYPGTQSLFCFKLKKDVIVVCDASLRHLRHFFPVFLCYLSNKTSICWGKLNLKDIRYIGYCMNALDIYSLIKMAFL